MASYDKCPFCGEKLDSNNPRCSNCGAENLFYGVNAGTMRKLNRLPDRGAPRSKTPDAGAAPGGGGPSRAPAGSGVRPASTGKCPYCGSVLRSDEKRCPGCGAVNKGYIEDKPRTIRQPKTIEELKEYCAERGMPLLRMRFFVGEDFKEPKAFGIYRDGKDVVVYKNKADGSRAVRYKGPDEAHGVDELFRKLLDECHSRGIYPDGERPPAIRPDPPRGRGSDSGSTVLKIVLSFVCFTLFPLFIMLLNLLLPFLAKLAFILLPAVLVMVLLKKLLYRGKKPEFDGAAESGPVSWKEGLRYLGYSLRYGSRPCLTPRESHLDEKLGWIASLARLLISGALVLAIVFSVRGIRHSDDGFYCRANGSSYDIYYQYGGEYRYAGSVDAGDGLSGYSLSFDEGGYSYLGGEWEEDWGQGGYDTPSFWDDVEDAADSVADSIRSSSHSSSDSDSWSPSDYDSWNPSDTDWDPDW